ncbi:2OG-Fe(II) oxygenase family protein [Lentisalinibacter sediminis]|uniref:2OG-Fe(II) oxygenase family protein n=1 Tax=Lentisalinibacter sediminis TaxID=2992237 RepID=UPI003866FC44
MNEAGNRSGDLLLRGDRVPDFSLPSADGRTLLFYEYATGGPLLIGACATGWDAATRTAFAAAVRELAEAWNWPSIVVCDSGSTANGSADHIVLIDSGARLRARLFGGVLSENEGVCAATDANLRLLDGCVVTAEELVGESPAPEMRAMVAEASGQLAEDEDAGMAAPVLIVPRVLPEALCAELCDRFAEWNPLESPMPGDDGASLRTDSARKSRRDATIDDSELEQEVTACIARRVLPEVSKAFHYRATRFERPKLVCYAADGAGHFAAHRDNTAPATAHRRFALTLNLNAGHYRGGALRFPEYSRTREYSPPAGGAIVFSCSHAHRVTPVTRGERYALVSFMFADEAQRR